jgi:uncharacterized membrane protein
MIILFVVLKSVLLRKLIIKSQKTPATCFKTQLLQTNVGDYGEEADSSTIMLKKIKHNDKETITVSLIFPMQRESSKSNTVNHENDETCWIEDRPNFLAAKRKTRIVKREYDKR